MEDRGQGGKEERMRQGSYGLGMLLILLACAPSHGQAIVPLRGHGGPVFAVAFHPDGQVMASAGVDHRVLLWDAATGRALRTLRGHEDKVLALAYAPDGRLLASAGRDGTVCLWDAATGKLQRRLTSEETCIHALAFAGHGKLACCGQGGFVEVWDLTTGRHRSWRGGLAEPTPLYCLAVSPVGEWLAVAGQNGPVLLHDLQGGPPRQVLEGHTEEVYSLGFAPDGRTLFSGSADRSVRVWDLAGGRQQVCLQGHQAAVYQVACSPDGRHIASAAVDGEVLVWDSSSHRRLYSHRFPGKALCAAFTPDGRRLATGTGQATCFVMELPEYLR